MFYVNSGFLLWSNFARKSVLWIYRNEASSQHNDTSRLARYSVTALGLLCFLCICTVSTAHYGEGA